MQDGRSIWGLQAVLLILLVLLVVKKVGCTEREEASAERFSIAALPSSLGRDLDRAKGTQRMQLQT